MLEWMLFRVIMVAFFILASSFFVAAEFALVKQNNGPATSNRRVVCLPLLLPLPLFVPLVVIP